MSMKRWIGLMLSVVLVACSGGSGPATGTGGGAGTVAGSGGVSGGSGGISGGGVGGVSGGSGGRNASGGATGTGGAILPADCRQAACPGGFYCDLGTGACKVGCALDADCGAAPNQACDIAAHQCGCKSGFHTCGGACVSSTATTSCGGSCDACPTDPAGSATCDGTTCGITCNTGYLKCGGVCVACADPHGTASCSGNACSLRCQTGYNLCGGRCASATDPTACGASCTVCPVAANQVAMCQQGACSAACAPGATVCKGRCATGTCTWTTHQGTGNLEAIGMAVDASDVVHVATVYQTALSYYRVAGTGALSPETVTGASCSSAGSYGLTPLVAPDGSGKARIICQTGVSIGSFTWNGSAWTTASVFAGTGYGEFSLAGTIDRIAFGQYNGSTYTLYYGELASGRWTMKTVSSSDPIYGVALGGVTGAAQLAWIPGDVQTNIDLVNQTSTGFSTPQVLARPANADALAFDPSGNLLAADTGLVLHTYKAGAWTTETIATATATGFAIDMVIDSAGVLHVVWGDTSGVHLATRFGTTWYVERVTATTNTGVKIVVGPTGKVAISTAVNPMPFAIFE